MADEERKESQEQASTPENQQSSEQDTQASQSEPAGGAEEQSSQAVQGSAKQEEAASGAEEQSSQGEQVKGKGSRDRSSRSGFGRGPRRDDSPGDGLDEQVVKIYRCATVVRGGRRFSFAALVVVGDRNGRVGIGYGKANEVPSAVEKGAKIARRNMIRVKLAGRTIPHQIMSKYGASKVAMVPAGEGTGVIAGASVRAVLELAGVKDVLTKSFGSNGPKNLVKATWLGLCNMRDKEEVQKLREVSLAD